MTRPFAFAAARTICRLPARAGAFAAMALFCTPAMAQSGVPVPEATGAYRSGAYPSPQGGAAANAAARAVNNQGYPFPYPFPGSAPAVAAPAAPVAASPAPGGAAAATNINPQSGRPLQQVSWTFEPPPPPRQFRLHDQITVMVKETSQVQSKGEMDRRKQADGRLKLTDWILLNKFSVVPDPQTAGNPTIAGGVDNKLRSQADLKTRDTMSFTITCEVTDLRPNGLLVLSGIKSVKNNDDAWEQCLTGLVRPEDVMPNNTVTSEKVAEMRIFKRESGHVPDGYRRGWLLRWLDTYQPF